MRHSKKQPKPGQPDGRSRQIPVNDSIIADQGCASVAHQHDLVPLPQSGVERELIISQPGALTELSGVESLGRSPSYGIKRSQNNEQPYLLPEEIIHYLQRESTLLELVAIQIYQQLIERYGTELDQQMTSETILTHLTRLVQERFDRDGLWVDCAKEIWSSLVQRTLHEMERDLGHTVLESLDWQEFNQFLLQYLLDESGSLPSRIQHLEEFHANAIALRIIEDLNLNDQSITALKRLLRLSSDGTKLSAAAIAPDIAAPGPIAEIPSEFPVLSYETSDRALNFSEQLQANLWESDAHAIAYLRYHSKHNRNHYLEHHITSTKDLELLPWEATDQLLSKFGLQAAKVHLVLTGSLYQQTQRWTATHSLSLDDLMEILGWDLEWDRRSSDPEAARQAQQLTGLLYALSCLLFKIVWLDPCLPHKRKPDNTIETIAPNVHTPVSKLWDILIDPQGIFDWSTGLVESAESIEVLVRPGLWTYGLVGHANPLAESALNQFAAMAKLLLELDAYSNDLAVRLVIYLMLDGQVRASDSNPHEYQVRSLLDAVLPDDDLERAQRNLNEAHILFNQWNQALMLLGRLGWSAIGLVDDATDEALPDFYVSPYPKWLDPTRNVRKPRGWVQNWLEQRLMIYPMQM